MRDYQLLKATNLDGALDYLAEMNGLHILAGGTDLLIDIKKNNSHLADCKYLLDISRIREMDFIREEGDYLEIGSLITHGTLCQKGLVKELFPVLSRAARTVGSTQIRNRATIGGNICNASPAADLLPPLIALEAEAVLYARQRSRTMALKDFITGPYQTELRKDEILYSIKIPLGRGKRYQSFQKIGRRRALAIARINLALVTELAGGRLENIRIVPGAVTPRPYRFTRLEEAVAGKKLAELDLAEAGRAAAEEMVAITGERWSTPYKRPALAALVKRAFTEVMKEVEADG
ncbi:MAG: xanthine dehydrogenase family protein subunit M [Halanaerobium sp.]|nr:xanthine dehydrogenase family protein subunit M [Halanaerobium sp.]